MGRARIAIPPACYRSLSGPSGPKCPRECPRKWGGVRGSVRRGVQKVSRECPQSVRDHLFDTLGTPRRTLPRTPPHFRGTLSGTLREHFGPKGRETPVAGRRDRKARREKGNKAAQKKTGHTDVMKLTHVVVNPEGLSEDCQV